MPEVRGENDPEDERHDRRLEGPTVHEGDFLGLPAWM
jgi:hypothetical protein